jgi:hypothetical protein
MSSTTSSKSAKKPSNPSSSGSSRSSRSSGSSHTRSTHTRSSSRPATTISYTDSITRLRNEVNLPPERYIHHFYPNPLHIRLLRFFLYTLTSLSSIVCAAFAICVIQWYNSHDPSIKPAWSSDIALIVFGLGTPLALFFTLLIAPMFFKKKGLLKLLGQVRTELLLLFLGFQIWISGSIAMAADLRGYNNCIW